MLLMPCGADDNQTLEKWKKDRIGASGISDGWNDPPIPPFYGLTVIFLTIFQKMLDKVDTAASYPQKIVHNSQW